MKLHNNSANGTYINQQRVTCPMALNEGDTIQIGVYTLLFYNQVLEVFDRGDQIRLDAHSLTRKVLDESKQERVILQDISLAIEPGQLVALVGISWQQWGWQIDPDENIVGHRADHIQFSAPKWR